MSEKPPEEEFSIKERLDSLPSNRRLMYDNLFGYMSLNMVMSTEEIDAWNEFMLSYLTISDEFSGENILTFFKNPESDTNIEVSRRIKIEPVFSKDISRTHNPRKGYMTSGGYADTNTYLDAPYAFTMSYQTDNTPEKENWVAIATVAFRPDLKRQELIIDQVQGFMSEDDTLGPSEKKARRIPMKFEIIPPEVLFILAQRLAERCEFKKIFLRKRKHNKWPEVAEKKDTLYDRISDTYGFKKSKRRNKYYVKKNIDIWFVSFLNIIKIMLISAYYSNGKRR